MTKVYEVNKPYSLVLDAAGEICFGAVFLCFSCFFFGIVITTSQWVDVFNISTCPALFVFFGLVFGGTGLYWAWRGCRMATRFPYSIAVCGGGTVLYFRLLRKTAIPASRIQTIEKVIAPGTGDRREIRIQSTSGTVPMNHFGEAEDFIADLTAINPDILVSEVDDYYDVAKWMDADEDMFF